MRSHRHTTPPRSGGTLARLAVLAALVALAPPAGAQATFAGGLAGPAGVTELADGTVLVTDYSGGQVWAYPVGGGARTSFATGLDRPYHMAQLADGRVLIAESGRGRVLAYAAGGGAPSTFAAGLSIPIGITQLPDGRVLVAEFGAGRVSAYPVGGGSGNRTVFATGLAGPVGVMQLTDGRVLVAEYHGARVSAHPAGGGGARTDFATGLAGPTGVVQLVDGRVLVAEYGNDGRVSAYSSGGGNASRTDFATGLARPNGVAQLSDGRVLIAEFLGNRVSTFATAAPEPEPVACGPAAPLSFDADGSGGAVTAADFSATPDGVFGDASGEFAGVRHEGAAGDAPADLAGCSFVSFDPFAETVVAAVPATGTVDPGGVHTFATAGGDQALSPDALFDDPGAFALVTGTASVGDPVSTVFGRVVAAVVYDRGGGVVASVRGGLPPAGAEAQAATFAAAMARVFGRATSAEGEGGVDLAVRAWPNPSAGRATVGFGLAAGGAARVAVYDALGREVAVVADRPFGAGRHEVRLASPLPAGVYVVRVATPAGVATARLTVAR